MRVLPARKWSDRWRPDLRCCGTGNPTCNEGALPRSTNVPVRVAVLVSGSNFAVLVSTFGGTRAGFTLADFQHNGVGDRRCPEGAG